MGRKPLISVVIPSYNHAPFIERAIMSVVKQTYSPIELIIVDDGSTDNSVEIIERAIKKKAAKSRNISIIFISQENCGAHNALNKGLNLASGKFLTILNSDDFFFLKRIEILYCALSKSNSELAFSFVRHIDNAGEPLAADHAMKKWYDKAIGRTDLPTVGFRLLINNIGITTGNFFFSKRLFENVGGFRDFVLLHDYDFLLRSLFYSEPLLLKKELMAYRVHESNTIKKYSHLQDLEGLKMSFDYFKKCILEPRPRNKKAPCFSYWKEFYGDFWKLENSAVRHFIGATNPKTLTEDL